MTRSINITKDKLCELISESLSNSLNEADWNFHHSRNMEHSMKPYGSDSKYAMIGRETGHFGSGTYFSTYQGSDDRKQYVDNTTNFDPHFIKVGDSVYRVNFDIYKNLYRVHNKRQGDVLFTLLRNVNVFYNRICSSVIYDRQFKQKDAKYDTSKQYQIIRANAQALNLKCPSYLELIRLAQNHEGDQSFSTVFMEYNGYNGVNVSGVDFYDNTKHGSVIYDLSKTNTDMEEVLPNAFSTYGDYYNNTVAYEDFGDIKTKSLSSKLYSSDFEKLSSLPLGDAMRVLKNYTENQKVLSPYEIGLLGDSLAKRYLIWMYKKNPTDSWGSPMNDVFFDRKYVELMIQNGLYFWANYHSNKGSMFIKMLDTFSDMMDWSLTTEEENTQKKEFLKNVMMHLKRVLTTNEQKYIDEYYYTSD